MLLNLSLTVTIFNNRFIQEMPQSAGCSYRSCNCEYCRSGFKNSSYLIEKDVRIQCYVDRLCTNARKALYPWWETNNRRVNWTTGHRLRTGCERCILPYWLADVFFWLKPKPPSLLDTSMMRLEGPGNPKETMDCERESLSWRWGEGRNSGHVGWTLHDLHFLFLVLVYFLASVPMTLFVQADACQMYAIPNLVGGHREISFENPFTASTHYFAYSHLSEWEGNFFTFMLKT